MTRITTTILTCLLATMNLQDISCQTIQNLAFTATELSASAETDGHPVSLISDNRYANNAKYWSSYQDEEHLGLWAYVEMGWRMSQIIKEVRAHWASDGENVLLPTEAYVAGWDGSAWQRLADMPTASRPPTSTMLRAASVCTCAASEPADCVSCRLWAIRTRQSPISGRPIHLR